MGTTRDGWLDVGGRLRMQLHDVGTLGLSITETDERGHRLWRGSIWAGNGTKGMITEFYSKDNSDAELERMKAVLLASAVLHLV